jgi:hypothetical protein
MREAAAGEYANKNLPNLVILSREQQGTIYFSEAAMSVGLSSLDDLPCLSGSDVFRTIAETSQTLQEIGCMAAKTNGQVEMVLMSPALYAKVVEAVSGALSRERHTLVRLTDEFDLKISAMNADGAVNRFDAAFGARDWKANGPKAGSTF